MSDGNFNRALLPHTPYASGMKAGKSIARVRAVETFVQWLRAEQPSITQEEVKAKADKFSAMLSQVI